MKNLHATAVLSAFLLVVIASACGGPATEVPATQNAAPVEFAPPQATEAAPAPIATRASKPTPVPVTGGQGQEASFMDLDPSNFEDSTNINNKWSPMQPGTQWIYDGTIVDAGQIIPHRIEFTVTDLTKEIQGVRTVVTWSSDYTGGKLVEKELSFYAQDKEGRVWYLGEYPEEFEDGEFVKAPTWIAGIAGARAGVKLEGNPQLGAANVYQGWGPAVEWSDFGHVDQMGLKVCVPVNCYQDVLVVAESSLGETGASQLKYFAPDVGEVQVGWKGADDTQEELVLTEYSQLTPEALAEVHAQALDLEKHGFEVSPDVYALTSPMQ